MKMVFFFLYEMTCFIIYIGVYMNGTYIEAKDDFKRKVDSVNLGPNGEEYDVLESQIVHITRVILLVIGGLF